VRRVDNLLEPDLVAPGNKILGAASTASTALKWNLLAATSGSSLVAPLGVVANLGETQMVLSGTSIAAPAVAAPPRCCCKPTPV
jgi:serine protease AprX